MNVLEAIKNRRSVRAYKSDPIPAETLAHLEQALRFAPSACNYQPWHFIFVTEKKLRHKLAEAAHNQKWIADAPMTLVACGFPGQAYSRMGGYGNSVDIDVACAVDHLMLTAASEGLGTCWIGAFDESAVKKILKIPSGVKVVAMTPLGIPASPDLNHPITDDRRKPLQGIFSTNLYAGPEPPAGGNEER